MAGIVVAIKLVYAILSFLFERNSAKRKRKQEALKEAFDGIKDKDPSAVTAAIDDINNA